MNFLLCDKANNINGDEQMLIKEQYKYKIDER